MTGKEYADIIDGFDVEHNSTTTGCSATIMTTKPLMKSTSCCGSRSCRFAKIWWKRQ